MRGCDRGDYAVSVNQLLEKVDPKSVSLSCARVYNLYLYIFLLCIKNYNKSDYN